MLIQMFGSFPHCSTMCSVSESCRTCGMRISVALLVVFFAGVSLAPSICVYVFTEDDGLATLVMICSFIADILLILAIYFVGSAVLECIHTLEPKDARI